MPKLITSAPHGKFGVFIEFEVIEYFDDDAPEAFGFVHLPAVPNPGDIIMLKWLDGKDAYQVKVNRINGTTLHVRSVPTVATVSGPEGGEG